MSTQISEIRNAGIYVGTYHKYNCGSLYGKWMKLSDYADKDEFLKACRELHKDESDPELMYQDHEFIPEELIGESWVSPLVWDLMQYNYEDILILSHYVSACSIDITEYEDAETLMDEAKEAFIGLYEDAEEYGQECFDEFIAPFIEPSLRDVVEYHFNMKEYGEEMLADYLSDDDYYYDTTR